MDIRRCPHRNHAEGNQIIDSGDDPSGYAIDIQGETRDITLRGNQCVETRDPRGRVAVRIGAQTSDVVLEANEFSGFETPVQDLRAI